MSRFIRTSAIAMLALAWLAGCESQPVSSGPRITPPPIEGQVERKLHDAIDALDVGGRGRYVVVHLPRLHKLAVYDVCRTEVVSYVDAPSEKTLFAAGRSKLVVIDAAANIFRRYDLASGREELANTMPVNGTVQAIALGADSDGPAVFCWTGPGGGCDLLDIMTLKRTEAKGTRKSGRFYGDERINLRASANGKVVGAWRTRVSPTGLFALELADPQVAVRYAHTSVGHVAPSPDGRTLYTARGIYNTQLARVDSPADSAGPACVPACSGPWFLSVGGGSERGREATRIALHVNRDTRPLLVLDGLPALVPEPTAASRAVLSLDQRVHFVPEAELLVLVPASNDRLIFRRLNVMAALADCKLDYLFVSSTPPPARAGRAWRYAVAVRSRRGGVKLSLASGPEGMTLRGNVLRWKAPPTAPATPPAVVLRAADASGQETFQAFTVELR